jgi:tetratricopeptide (TPR) repeat protein
MPRHLKLITVASIAATAVAAPTILAVAQVRAPVVAAVAVALSAIATIFAGFWRSALLEALRRDRDQAMSIQDGCLTIRGHLPRVREITEPTWLGVHAAREVPSGTEAPPGTPVTIGHQPPYVPRDIDAELREHLAGGGFVLLVGDSTAGKTRAAYEAVAATMPDHILIAPQYRQFLAAALDRARQLARSVLWLDDLERFLGEEGLTRSRIIRLLDDAGRHHAVVATIRAAELDTYTHADNAARPLARNILDCLALARRIDISRLLSPSELARAEMRTWDSRITEALGHSDRFGLAEYLTAGPELLYLWRAARDGGSHVLGAALVAAAVDSRRAGLTCPLPRDLIETLARSYLPIRGGTVAQGEPLAEAWNWATHIRTTTALLTSVSADTFGVFDYLVDEVERTAGPVPDVALTRALSKADAADAMRIGTIARVHGRYEIALSAYSHAREVRAKSLGPDHADTLTSWGNLAAVLRSLGRLNQAEAEHRAVLRARISVLGPDDPATLATRTNLALVLHDLGRLEEAEVELRAVLKARVRALGPDHPSTLTNRNNLAFVLHDLGHLTEAETEHCAVLEAYVRILGLEEADKPVNVAAVLRALGSLEDAEAEHRAILDTSTRVFGADHPDAVTSRGSPTLVLHAVERLDEAESLHRTVYEGFLRVLGADHPSTLTARSNLAVVLHAQGRVTEAEQEHRAVVEGFRRILGPDHPSTLASRSNLAVVLYAAGRATDASSECYAVVEGFTRVLGPAHPSTLTSRNYLAFMMHATGRATGSAMECRKVVDGFTAVLGPDHPSTLTSRTNLAVALHGIGELEQAEIEHRAAVSGFTRLRGPDHPSTLTSRAKLAETLLALNRRTEAEAEYRAVLAGFSSVLGPDHPRSVQAKAAVSAFGTQAS